jgi:outer membrane protein insertion porin family/translocation and assembly module TamA
VCDDETIESLRLHQRLSPLQLTASVDRSDIPFSPTKGYIARVELEHASRLTVSDYRYNRVFAEASMYTHFRYPSRDPRSQVLAGNVRFGWVNALSGGRAGDLLHPRKRFYAGGSHSVRGFDENQLGPRILTVPPAELGRVGCDTTGIGVVDCAAADLSEINRRQLTPRPTGGRSLIEASVEYRMPFRLKMEWAVFLDAARIGGSRLAESDTTVSLPGMYAITPGVGFRYRSPVGPVRVDLGIQPPRGDDHLRLVTTVREPDGTDRLVMLRNSYNYGTGAGWTSLSLKHVVVHLSIGQAY